MRTNLIRFALPVLAVLTISACADQMEHGSMPHRTPPATSPSSPAGSSQNPVDIAFATAMIPHHGQAITMADLAAKAATDPAVKRLATAIKAAQGPEIELMSSWLKRWGVPVPSPTGHEGHGMSGMAGEGMMSADEMGRLGAAHGVAFDRMWVEMMIRHHEGAIAMARTELGQGSNAEAKTLAQAIIDGQTEEIETMKALLPRLG